MKKTVATNIFTIEDWEHFTENHLSQWIIRRDYRPQFNRDEDEISAKIIEEDFLEPLSKFIHKKYQEVPNSFLIKSAQNLQNYLQIDVADKFHEGLTIVIEQVGTLDNLINKFLTDYQLSQSLRQSSIKSKIASVPRKEKPSKDDLEKDKDAYFAKDGKNQGWMKQAKKKYELDAKTINLILKN